MRDGPPPTITHDQAAATLKEHLENMTAPQRGACTTLLKAIERDTSAKQVEDLTAELKAATAQAAVAEAQRKLVGSLLIETAESLVRATDIIGMLDCRTTRTWIAFDAVVQKVSKLLDAARG